MDVGVTVRRWEFSIAYDDGDTAAFHNSARMRPYQRSMWRQLETVWDPKFWKAVDWHVVRFIHLILVCHTLSWRIQMEWSGSMMRGMTLQNYWKGDLFFCWSFITKKGNHNEKWQVSSAVHLPRETGRCWIAIIWHTHTHNVCVIWNEHRRGTREY